jgi:3-oxoacyl-[acyl-carrier protein] reductase
MVPQRFGRIVNFSSIAVGLHSEGSSAYAASKSAIVELTKVLANELADAGITCNVVAPSVVPTDMLDTIGEDAVRESLGKLTLKRPLTIEEVCHVVAFLAAPESACVTGQVIQLGLVS